LISKVRTEADGAPTLDPLRDHARRGTTPEWPVNERRIYEADQAWLDKEGNNVQLGFEHGLFETDEQEWYSILVVFGREFAINVLQPSIDGYRRWIDRNAGACPSGSTRELRKLYRSGSGPVPIRGAGRGASSASLFPPRSLKLSGLRLAQLPRSAARFR